MTLNSKEENSEDFCLDFVHEFGLWTPGFKASWDSSLSLSDEEKRRGPSVLYSIKYESVLFQSCFVIRVASESNRNSFI